MASSITKLSVPVRLDEQADYFKMAAGYDGRELINILKVHLPAGSSVLEL